MFRKIILDNFQKWKHLVVTLAPVTTLQGPSDQGKSSIMRALRFLCLNTPPRGRYVNFGADVAKIQLFAEKNRIVRRKGEKGNKISYYTINGKKFRAVGLSAPPEEIQKALLVSETNFQQQISLPYWFADSAAEVSRQLNQIINLSIIDTTMVNIGAVVRETKMKVKVTEERIRQVEEQVKKSEWVDAVDKSLTKVESIKSELDETQDSYARIKTICDGIRMHRISRGIALRAKAAAESVLEVGRRAIKAAERAAWLDALLTEIGKQQVIQAAPILDLSQITDTVNRYKKVKDKHSRLSSLIESIELQERKLCQATVTVKESKARIKKLTKGKCPACGTRLRN